MGPILKCRFTALRRRPRVLQVMQGRPPAIHFCLSRHTSCGSMVLPGRVAMHVSLWRIRDPTRIVEPWYTPRGMVQDGPIGSQVKVLAPRAKAKEDWDEETELQKKLAELRRRYEG